MMGNIKGVGVDVVDVKRMKTVLEKQKEYFLNKVFSDMEVTYCRTRKKPYIHFAARFAAKEAVAKAMRTGWSGAFHWRDIEVVNDQSGAPHILLSREVAKHWSNVMSIFLFLIPKILSLRSSCWKARSESKYAEMLTNRAL